EWSARSTGLNNFGSPAGPRVWHWPVSLVIGHIGPHRKKFG
ncbi:5639_t:CDS:1, partial [Dentiscutata erythropus]